jgi:hypothetical protein
MRNDKNVGGFVALHRRSPLSVGAWLRLVCVVLVVTGTIAAPVRAAAPVWHTSGDLMRRTPASFQRLDAAGVEAVLARLPKSLTLIPAYLRDQGVQVHLHKGDLTIDGSFANTHVLVVDGNVTMRGSYDDYRGGGVGILLVLGDLLAEHVVSWGSIAVTGTLKATGLVYAYYNDYTFEVAGPVRARAVIVFDKSTNAPRVQAPVVQNDDGAGTALAVRHFVPELMIEDVLDKTDAESAELAAVASYETARTRIAAGEPIFRESLGPESLATDVLRLFKPGVDAAARARLARTDRLLALVIAARPR